MCKEVDISRRDGRVVRVETVGELRYELGAANIVVRPDWVHPLPSHSCLCPIDIVASAERAGLTCVPDEHDPMFMFQIRER
jgi:hypothetical protein